jgi:aminopeptidase N
LERTTSREENLFLLEHDTDPFNRWEASRTLAREGLIAMITDGVGSDTLWLDALKTAVSDSTLDPAYRALLLSLPTQSELAQTLFEQGVTPDPMAIWTATDTLREDMAKSWADILPALVEETKVTETFKPDAEQSGKRALAASVLAMQTRLDGGAVAKAQFETADNMTLQLSALTCLIQADAAHDALKAFYDQWKDDRLVMDKWFGLQVGAAKPADAANCAKALTEHPDFDWKNPNRFRAVFGSLAMNHAGFHNADGSGYALLADWLIKLDAKNPQTTARMCTAFQTWKRYDADRQSKMRACLTRISETPGLSRDTTEMVSRLLG